MTHYETGVFANIVGINFVSSYLVINVQAETAISGSSTPPPFAKFVAALPKTEKVLSQAVISQTKKSDPGGTTLQPIYSFWDAAFGPVPTSSTYNIDINAINGGGALPPPLGGPLNIFFNYGDQYSTQWISDFVHGTVSYPSGGLIPGYFGTLADAAATAAYVNSAYTGETVAFWASTGGDVFELPPFNFQAYTIDIPVTVVPSADSKLNVVFIIAIPEPSDTMRLIVSLPSNGVTLGWASVFTNQKKAIKTLKDFSGVADMSVYLPQPTGPTEFDITTTGTNKAGTVSVPGSTPTAPLPADAPPIPP